MDLTDCSTVNTPSGRVVTCTSSKKAITSDGCIETLNCFQGSVLTQSEQGLQYKITLFAFALSNLMNNPSFSPKNVWKGARRTAKTKGRNVSPFGIWPTAPITAQLKENTVSPGLCHWQLAMLSHPALVAKTRWNGFVVVPKLAMNCLAIVLATFDDVTNSNSPHSSILLLQRCHQPHCSAARNSLGSLLGRKIEQLRGNMLQSASLPRRGRRCSLCRYAPCCSTTCRPQPMKKFVFVQLKLSGWNCPQNFLRYGIAWHGRASILVPQCVQSVFVAGATGDASSAWRAVDLAHADASLLRPKRSTHSLFANF